MLIVVRSPAGNDTNLIGNRPLVNYAVGWRKPFIEMLGPARYKYGIILKSGNICIDFIVLRHGEIRASNYTPPLLLSSCVCWVLFPFFCGEVLKDSLSDAISRLPRIF